MTNLYLAIEHLQDAWRIWGESNYNVRDDSFQKVIQAVSAVESTYAALKDAGALLKAESALHQETR